MWLVRLERRNSVKHTPGISHKPACMPDECLLCPCPPWGELSQTMAQVCLLTGSSLAVSTARTCRDEAGLLHKSILFAHTLLYREQVCVGGGGGQAVLGVIPGSNYEKCS